MRDVFICDAARTAIGRYGGALAKVRTDDLAAVPIKALVARNDKADWTRLDEVFFGCANQSGEDNRNVARMALLLAGLPDTSPGLALHRLGARFINPLLKAQYGVDSMAETGENVAEEFQVKRADQDAFALRSQQRAGNAIATGYFAKEIVPVAAPGGKSGPIMVSEDEHPRPDTTLENLQKLKPIVRNPGTITAGNASGINDGAAAIILASEDAVKAHRLKARARGLGMPSAAVPPRIMGIGPVPSTRKLMERLGLKISDFDLIELNEAFASQGIACLRQLGVKEDADFVNPHGGAIALGHPLGMSGARLTLTAVHGLEKRGGKRALATMCVGVGQGVSLALEKI